MTEMRKANAFGRQVLGLGVLWIGMLTLAWRDFVPGEPVPGALPGRAALALAAGIFLAAAGAALQWRRTAAPAAALLTVYYGLLVVGLMNGRSLLARSAEYGTYSGVAEQLSIAAGSLIVFATTARIGNPTAMRLAKVGRAIFGLCALLFGGAHFVYMNLTAPLVPKWLPPSQIFWGYATGIAFLMAGVALLTGIQARLAAILLTAMLGCFAVIIHEPMLIANPHSRWNWSESALSLTILGAAWAMADAQRRRSAAGDTSRKLL